MHIQQVKAPEEIKKEITRLRAREGTWRTNLFASDAELVRWCAQDALSLVSTERSFFLLHHRRTFCHAFFCTVDPEDAKNALVASTKTVEDPISMDILGNDDELRDMLAQASFCHAVTLKRMMRLNNAMQAENLPVKEEEFARTEELSFLMEQIYNNFDSLTKQVPDENELLEMVQHKKVLVLRTADDNIQAFLVFALQGAVLLLRYIVVVEEWRGKSLGAALLQKFLGIRHGIRKHQLWVKTENLSAVRLYEKHGFRFDGLRDDVYVFLKANCQAKCNTFE